MNDKQMRENSEAPRRGGLVLRGDRRIIVKYSITREIVCEQLYQNYKITETTSL